MLFQANILINLILSQYFNNTSCLIILTQHRVEYFNYRGELPTVFITLRDTDVPKNLIFKYYGCKGIIVIGKDPTDIFENLELKMKFASDRFNFRRYLLISTQDFAGNVKSLESKAMRFVEDILIICSNSSRHLKAFKEDEYIFDLYTHTFVGSEEHLTDIIWLDRWYSGNRSFLKNSNLYPDKICDQRGRRLKIVCFTYKPFTIVNPPDGTDILVLKEYAIKHNMTIELVVDEESIWGNFYSNGTGYGIVGKLGKDVGDVAVAALHRQNRYRFFDFSIPITRSGITCIAPVPRPVTGLIIPFVPFSSEMWLMTALSYLVVTVIMYMAISVSIKEQNRRKYNETWKFLMAFCFSGRVFLLQDLNKQLILQRARLLVALALILTWLLHTTYNSGLSSTMTVPRYHGLIRDVKDLALSGIKWSEVSDAWTVTLRNDDREVYKKVVKSFIDATEEELASCNDKHLAYAVERLLGGHLAIRDYVTLEGAQKRRLLDKDLYWEDKIILLRKNSVLQSSLDTVIFGIMESGLAHFWEYKMVVKYMDINIQKAIKENSVPPFHRGSDHKIKLGFNHIIGAFTIWCIGIAFSIAVFIYELIKQRKV
ncbi:hypothetical protein Trydic_g11805 [Trypoxylus dichotomus]